MSVAGDKMSRWRGEFRSWARRVGLDRKLAYILVVVAVGSGMATVATMTGPSALGTEPRTILILLYLDAALLFLLGIVVARQVIHVWIERRQGLAGSRLHIRLVVLFSLVAVTPAILVAIFSGLFLNFGVQAWFSERVRTALNETVAVATAYLHEHQQNIRSDALAMANDLNRDAPFLIGKRARFNQVLTSMAALRSMPEALVVDGRGRVLARAPLSLSLEFSLVPPSALEKARRGETAVLTSDKDDRVRAIVKLDRFIDAYLLVGRFVEPRVLGHIARTDQAVNQYRMLEEQSKGIQISFVMIFVVVALLLLLAAIWLGLTLATQLARPIIGLIGAAEKIREGDLSVRVEASDSGDEVENLGRAFNRMTSQLESQRKSLVTANRQLDERRRFTETVLAGVSAGVIGLDAAGNINLPNRPASELLVTDLEQRIGENLADAVPEMAGLLKEVMDRPERLRQSEVKLVRQRHIRNLLVRIAAERLGGEIVGYVVTFDDITELLSAQRKAAWSDIARRIAHEIKNPLTPIQLSAERLKRKYMKEIKTEPEVFSMCTDTIVRQVQDIGRMVDEFSSFARMPQATLKPENLVEICRQTVFLERNRHPDISFEVDLPDAPLRMSCDNRQIGQALTNILKNAAESITGRHAASGDDQAGHIRFSLGKETAPDGENVFMVVEDNGLGLPKEHQDRLIEPYVTTRDKGTGLGLAMVKKIMEDHSGDLMLENREEGGARVTLVFMRVDDPAPNESGDDDAEDRDADPMKVATEILAHGS